MYNTRQRNLQIQERDFSFESRKINIDTKRGRSTPKGSTQMFESKNFNYYKKSRLSSIPKKDQRKIQVEQTHINMDVEHPPKYLTPLNSGRKESPLRMRVQSKKQSNPEMTYSQAPQRQKVNQIRLQNYAEGTQLFKRTSSIDANDFFNPDQNTQRKCTNYYQENLKHFLQGFNNGEALTQLYIQHFIQQYNSLRFCIQQQLPDQQQLKDKTPQMKVPHTLKTVVFDLDETLVHCNEDANLKSDFKIPIQLPNGTFFEAGINIRPHTQSVLAELSKYCEIIVFTASHANYANKIINYLDPQNKWISYRLFRENCIQTPQGVHIKDLRVINRNLKNLVLVDNAAYSYGFQIDNGIPIVPFIDNKSDKELLYLLDYLKLLLQEEDVRELNRRTFQLRELQGCETLEEALIAFSK